MSWIDRQLEHEVRSALSGSDTRAQDLPVTTEDLSAFIDQQTLLKLSVWAATTQFGLRHKLTDMAIQAVK